jgi:tetratricopeptide (TPR) repeat protein
MAQDYKDFDAGVAKFRAGEYSRVVEMFSAMLDNPRHDKRFDEDLYFYRGRSYFHVNDFAKALDDLNQSLALNHYNRGILHLYMARCYDKLGKKDEAISNYKEALSVAEKNKRITAEILVDRAGFFCATRRQGCI